ncbi:MAG: hypothetical protein WBG95_06875 [Sulfitobacter sp.]
MKDLLAGIISLLLLAAPAWACGVAVCIVDPESLILPDIITFDETAAGGGPGHLVDDVLIVGAVQFGERFAGQKVEARGSHDAVTGDAFGPLTVMAGAASQNLSVVRFMGTSWLNGYGVAGFPKRDAQGEGAIAVLFDTDQSGLSLHIRGGETGRAEVTFLRRDGALLARVPVSPLGEFAFGFVRAQGGADIAGIVITNTDPQGIALDTIRFGKPPDLS